MPAARPFERWSKSEKAAWNAAAEADPLALEGQGSSSHWRASTRLHNQNGYGLWLGWLDAREPACLAEPAVQRATRDRVRSYLTEMTAVGLADYTRAGRLQGLADTLRTMFANTDTRFIGRVARQLHAEAKPMRNLEGRLRPALEILDIGYHLMQVAEEGRVPERRLPIAFRDGLLISLWACRMLRIGNLSQIAMGRNLLKLEDGHRLSFSPAETKQKRPFSCSWPARLESALDDYLKRYRPMLAERSETGSDYLWLSQFGKPMPQASVAQIISSRTRAAFGRSISSHLMRHIASTALAEAYPESSTDIAAVLGHADPETSEKHYILARGDAAVRTYGDFLEGLIRVRPDEC